MTSNDLYQKRDCFILFVATCGMKGNVTIGVVLDAKRMHVSNVEVITGLSLVLITPPLYANLRSGGYRVTISIETSVHGTAVDALMFVSDVSQRNTVVSIVRIVILAHGLVPPPPQLHLSILRRPPPHTTNPQPTSLRPHSLLLRMNKLPIRE